MRTILSTMFLLFCLSLGAQEELKVKSFLPSINDLTARTEVVKDNSGEPCALIKVVIADKDVTFECGNIASMIVGHVTFHTNEYWVYVAAGRNGAKHLKVKHPYYPTIDVIFSDYGFSTLESQTTYTLIISTPHKTSKFKKTSTYILPYGQLGMLSSIGGNIGVYLNNFNVEAYYAWGLSKSEEIYWISSSNTGGSSSYSYSYSPSILGTNVGYGIRIGEKFRLTPKVGIGIVSIKGKVLNIGDNNPDATKGYAVNMGVSVKAEYYLSRTLSVGIEPSYSVVVNKSDLYKRVSNVSTKIDNFGSGFNSKVFISFNF